MQNSTAIENRDLICAYISDNPGSHLRKIARDLDIKLSTLRYHLDFLVKKQKIVCQRQNNLKVYFLSGKLKPQEKTLAPLLQQQRYREIVLVLIDLPGSTSSQIADRLSIKPSTTSKYINILEDQKILYCKKIGRKKKYYINDEESVVGLLRSYKNLMSDMSFEIRTPMNTIIGMTSLLLDEKLTPEQRDFVETIKASGEALMAMITDILDFSRIEQEKIQLDHQAFDLRNCIEEALDIIAPKAAKKKINVAYEVDKNTPAAIIGDPNRLRQILINILIFAVGQMKKGEVLISVSSKQLDRFFEIHFSIEDTGGGIPQDKIDNMFKTYGQVINLLFESFNQIDFESIIEINESSINNDVGANLGLAISKKLARLMDGTIWVVSKLGEGTEIHLTINAEHANVTSPFSIGMPKLIGKKILIVDACRTNCRILDQEALNWGLISTSTNSAKEALRLIQSGHSFDIALLDINTTDMDGITLATNIRKFDVNLPLIALTSVGQHVKPGIFASTASKPIRHLKLRDKIISLLEKKSPSADIHPQIEAAAKKSTLNILLAEDNILNQKVFMTMLIRLGYEADAVSNGLEALKAMEQKHYDLVLMDIKMPEINGIEATKIIRQRWYDKPKIIAMTAYALAGDREKFLAAGMDDYISKPIKVGELKALLEKYHQT